MRSGEVTCGQGLLREGGGDGGLSCSKLSIIYVTKNGVIYIYPTLRLRYLHFRK